MSDDKSNDAPPLSLSLVAQARPRATSEKRSRVLCAALLLQLGAGQSKLPCLASKRRRRIYLLILRAPPVYPVADIRRSTLLIVQPPRRSVAFDRDV